VGVEARSTVKRLLVAMFAALFVGLVPAAGSAQSPDDDQPTPDESLSTRLDVVGVFKRFPSDLQAALGEEPKTAPDDNGANQGWPFLDTKNRRVFQLYELQAGGIAILIRNLDSMKPAGVIKIPQYKNMTIAYYTKSFPDAGLEIDEEGRRLFLWANSWNGAPTRGVVVVDWDRPDPRVKFTEIAPPDGGVPSSAASAGTPIVNGLTFEPSAGKLYVRGETLTEPMNVSLVIQIDAAQNDPVDVKLDWSRVIRACRSNSYRTNDLSGELPVLRSAAEGSLYVPCNPGAATAVVRIPLSEAGLPVTEEVFTGFGNGKQYLVDRIGNRIHTKMVAGRTGQAVLTFDVTRKAFVGVTALQDAPPPDAVSLPTVATPMAVDESTGRVYALGDQKNYGLTAMEGRLSPVPPGRQFPQVRGVSSWVTPAAVRFDPKTRRIFVPRPISLGGSNRTGNFVILRDQAPLPPPPTFDVDSLTEDVPDDEGVTTQADYSGGASAYGMRVLLSGGARGVPTVPVEPGDDFVRSACRASDRDLIFGRVDRAFLSTAGRSASAIASDSDVATKSDLAEPSRCEESFLRRPKTSTLADLAADQLKDNQNYQALYDLLAGSAYQQLDAQVGSRLPWPFRRTECPVPTEDGKEITKDTATGASPFTGSSSSVDCMPDKAQTIASASWRLPSPGVSLSVGDANSFTEVVRDPKRGLVSRAVSYVRDIDIGGVIQIDGVYAIAESFATGRPTKSNKIGAGTRYIRSVTAFRSPGFSCGHDGEDPCGDPSALVDAMNRAFANAQVTLRFPPLDPVLSVGTPGGYQAGVQREFYNSLNAEFSNGDSLREVPALEIIRINDSKDFGRQRQIIQFAGVLVNSQYGIRPLGEGFDPAPSSGSTDPVPPQEQVLGDAVEGLAPTGQAPSLSTTGGSPNLPPALAGPVPGPISAPGLGRRFTEGLSFLMRNPKTAGLMVGAWILLLLPGALAYRRRLLMNAVTSTGRGTS
jgi:hypothetical protein